MLGCAPPVKAPSWYCSERRPRLPGGAPLLRVELGIVVALLLARDLLLFGRNAERSAVRFRSLGPEASIECGRRRPLRRPFIGEFERLAIALYLDRSSLCARREQHRQGQDLHGEHDYRRCHRLTISSPVHKGSAPWRCRFPPCFSSLARPLDFSGGDAQGRRMAEDEIGEVPKLPPDARLESLDQRLDRAAGGGEADQGT